MTKAGLVEWSRPESDRRATQVVAAAEGRRRFVRLQRVIVRDNARLLASYQLAARRAAITILRQLAQRANASQRP